MSIPTTHTVSPPDSKPYTTYEVRVDLPFPQNPATLQKRYSEFAALDSILNSEIGAPPNPLPPKSFLSGTLSALGLGSTLGSPAQIEKRRAGLQEYLKAIEGSDDGRWRAHPAYRSFLNLSDGSKSKKDEAHIPGSQFGKDRVRDASDWLDKFQEVKSNLSTARRYLTDRETASTATAQHEAGANAKRGLVRAGTLLSALDEGLTRLGSASENSSLGEGEIRRRRDLLGSSRKERDGLESVLNSLATKGSSMSSSITSASAVVTDDQKKGLFAGASSQRDGGRGGGRVLGAAKETERTRELDNEGVLQLQRQIVAEQDEDLVDLTGVVRRMREMGVKINEELVYQNALLDEVEGDVERVDGKMKIAKRRIGKIR